jgi:hypothetical protein
MNIQEVLVGGAVASAAIYLTVRLIRTLQRLSGKEKPANSSGGCGECGCSALRKRGEDPL